MMDHKSFMKSVEYALEGVYYGFKYNQNLRTVFIIGALVVVVSLLLHVDAFQMGILGVMILLVISTEMINTAIEQMTDLITKEHKEEAKIAKDVSAGMVLITSLGSIVVGILVFLPYILKLFK